MSARKALLRSLLAASSVGGLIAFAYRPATPLDDLPNRIPHPAPYVAAEARAFPPPFEEAWEGIHNPGRCATCHAKIFEEWNGSMMSNAWRDPGWRAAFLLAARQTSTAGGCELPPPPDGTRPSRLNPFAAEDCTSRFDTGAGWAVTARPGSLLDGFCSQCHMPANFVDNVPLAGVAPDAPSGREHGALDPEFNPTSDDGTGLAFATLASRFRNTDAGRRGIFCAVCHTFADTREMPYGNYHQSGTPYPSVLGTGSGSRQDRLAVPDPASPSLGWAVGAGAFRLSPHAIGFPEFLGPLAAHPPANKTAKKDAYLSGVFARDVPRQQAELAGHEGNYQTLHERAELCASCHDVTNPLTVKNRLGRWVGGFPIERTYAEWAGSRYADRPGNGNFDPKAKRDCQTCHMQQDYGQPGTAHTLYRGGRPVPPRTGAVAGGGPERSPAFSHHFIGGNTFVPRMTGAVVDGGGAVQAYPELSVYSFTSADETSLYHNAWFENAAARGPATQHARLAWDRLRNVLDLGLEGPATAAAGSRAPLRVTVANSGSGHDFPSGFPEGRAAWVAVRAFDLASGRELDLYDSHWRRTSKGVGYLTREEMPDPNFPRCREWKLPAGSPDPFAVQFKAIASLGDGCPTLDLAWAAPLNLAVNGDGMPVDEAGRVIDRANPRGLPRYRDLDGDGDLYDDAFLSDTRLRPLPHAGATAVIDRYSVVVPPGVQGPVAVVAAVYYQSFEAVVAKKLLGNLADLDTDFRLEPCVLGGLCDGRTPSGEPAVVEGAPPVPMEVRSRLIDIRGGAVDRTPPAVRSWPAAGTAGVSPGVVVKAVFSEPVAGVDAATFTLTDEAGAPVPGFVDQIGDGTWALFPHQVFLAAGKTYTARLAPGVCDLRGNCDRGGAVWSFSVGGAAGEDGGDTSVPLGFPAVSPPGPEPAPAVAAIRSAGENGAVVVAFSRPVLNVTGLTLRVEEDGAAVAGRLSANPAGDRWTFTPAHPPKPGTRRSLALSPQIYDLTGRGLAGPYRRGIIPPRSLDLGRK
ncbi:MAG TPA: Ig-like domain-containing protein [Thermoanaerobaculia bacterium]|nr:Ig-like domain-containing protein [Thermoanaerobaculia bacterium]